MESIVLRYDKGESIGSINSVDNRYGNSHYRF